MTTDSKVLDIGPIQERITADAWKEGDELYDDSKALLDEVVRLRGEFNEAEASKKLLVTELESLNCVRFKEVHGRSLLLREVREYVADVSDKEIRTDIQDILDKEYDLEQTHDN